MGDIPSTSHDPEISDPVPQDSENEIREDQPLLHAPDEETWKPPRGFIWIQMAIMSNVFLYGLDSTITAATYAVISSEFDAANTASWLTTSYLITSTAFQPLYGRVSDIFGRRLCFFISTITFAIGCLGCAVANDIVILNIMRALSGFGGGGLMTMGKCNRRIFKAALLTARSNHCELRHDPLSQARNVPGSSKWYIRLWCYFWSFFWWFNRRPYWLEMVFPTSSPNISRGFGHWSSCCL